LLKKDSSQIGINAREAVKFLDRVTSGKDGLSEEAIVLQGPDEEYTTWDEVEEHLVKEEGEPESTAAAVDKVAATQATCTVAEQMTRPKVPEGVGSPLSQMLLNKLNFAKEPDALSISSTPPASPSSSGPQSSKTSPEVKSVKLVEQEASIVPPVLKPLLNSVVWYTYRKSSDPTAPEVTFLTNSAETASLARNFGIMPKNIHQLRTLIGLEEQEVKNHSKYEKKHPPPSSAVLANTEADPKPLFKYEEDSDVDDDAEDVVVFQPRGRGIRGNNSARTSPVTPVRAMNGHHRSPIPAFSKPSSSSAQRKPEVPVEAIDPDSFDRGSFGRGSVPLANTTPHLPGQFQGFRRGTPYRGNFSPAGSSRGSFSPVGSGRGGSYRGAPRGFDRGSVRGRGRLFVP
jgi:hypothetical protein